MGNAIARHGDTIEPFTASGHINTKYWVDGTETEGGHYQPSTKSATVSGTVSNTTSNVYANGKRVCVKGNSTVETDSYSLGSHIYVSGAHSGTTSGTISGGSATVFIGGVAVARQGGWVNTHSGDSTYINSGSGNVFVG